MQSEQQEPLRRKRTFKLVVSPWTTSFYRLLLPQPPLLVSRPDK
jgi:hypothetical protein